MDATGPETIIFNDLISLIARTLRRSVRILHSFPSVAYPLIRLLARMVGGIILTRDEIQGLMANLLVPRQPPPGRTRLSRWPEENSEPVGRRHASELARHFR